MYGAMETGLPVHRYKPRRGCLIDCSEPLFGLGLIIGSIGVVWNAIVAEAFDIFLGAVCCFCCCIGWWRVRRLGVAKKLMDSVRLLEDKNKELAKTSDSLSVENQKLKNSNKKIFVTAQKLEEENEKFNHLLGIMDVENKEISEVRDDLLVLISKYTTENNRQERNNKIALFYTVDIDRDGELSQDEIKLMRKVLMEEYGIDTLGDSSNPVSRMEFIDKLFKDKNYNDSK